MGVLRNFQPAAAVRLVLVLGRASNLPTVWSNAAAGYLVAGGRLGAIEPWLLFLGSTLLYLGGTTLNDAFDAAFDRRYRTDRPIPSGRVTERAVWILGAALMGSGSVLMLAVASPWLVALLVGSILLYDWLHKRWSGAVWIMGMCRCSLVLAAASAAAPGEWRAGALWLGAALLVYIAGITYTARAESGPEQESRWPLLLLVAPFACAIPIGTDSAHPIAIAVAAMILATWLALALRSLRSGRSGIGATVAALLAGLPLVDLLFVAAEFGLPALGWTGFCLAARLAQRLIPAT